VDSSVRSISPGASPNSLRPQSDYFGARQRPSTASTIASNISQTSAVTTPSVSNGFLGKKKPPPPPPKRIASGKPEEFVVALYAFDGQGQGDLSFREGDRIKIVKKTGTDQDWWVGELNGVKGSFPANYCRAA
jgi:amphiphysin